MRGLIGLLRHDDRGGVAIMVALSLTVLLGIAAIVIDAGALYQERRELQNGADAAALAVAEDCALGDCGPYGTTAAGLASANALDDAMAVDAVEIDHAARTVTVDTSTSTSEGATTIAHYFAPILGFDGSTVRASATALWGPLSGGPTLPIVLSECEWSTNGGGDPSQSPVTLPSGTVTIGFHDGNNVDACSGPAGQHLPGGFGWLQTTNGECETEVNADGWVGSSPGSSPPSTCSPADFAGKTFTVPVFYDEDGAVGTGKTGKYRVWGLATIEVKGMRLLMGNKHWTWGDISTCSQEPSGNTGQKSQGQGNSTGGPGTGSDQACLVAEFVQQFVPVGVPGDTGVPDLGTTAVRLIA